MNSQLQSRRQGVSRQFVHALESRVLFSAGQLDPSFGAGGKTTVDFHGLGVDATAIATESDGKTVEVGYATTGHGDATEFAVVRLNFDGTPDTTFGPNHNGIVLFQVGSSSDESGAEAVAIDGQNRILVAGSNNIVTVGSYNVGSDIYVARLLPSGTLDSAFGNRGIADVHFGVHNASDARAIALQTDGKIVVVGLNKGFVENFFGPGNTEIAVARLNTNGSLDSSFNDGGTETVGFSNVDAIGNAVAIDYSGTESTNTHYGSIVVGGYIDDGSAVSDMVAVRIKPNGGLDNSFFFNGRITIQPPSFSGGEVTGIVIQSTGDIVLSGTVGTYAMYGDPPSNGEFALVRLNPNGSPDKTFGNNAEVVTFGFGGADQADSLILGPNNRLIVGGSAGRLTAILSFTANGTLDENFGKGGIVTTDFNGATTAADAIAYLGDRIVAVGSGRFDTARYLDTNPSVAVSSFFYNTTENPAKPITFIVTRSQVLPYDTAVSFSIGGTAIAPTNELVLRQHREDYNLSGFNIPLLAIAGRPLPSPSVDIPAGQSYVLVTLTPSGDTFPGIRSATFSITPSTFYAAGTPNNLNININGGAAQPQALGANADAFVQDGASANTNFGSATNLVVKAGSAGFNRHAYVKFDISTITNINSVKLQLFGFLNSSQNSSVTADVYSVADTSWTESGITFNNAPAASAAPLAAATITGTTPTLYTWDVTAYVRAQKAAGHNIVSFELQAPLATDAAIIFNSREAAMGPSLQFS